MCTECVCGTPGCHDDRSGRAGEVSAAGWLLLRGLLEFSSGMLRNPPPPPAVPSQRASGEATWEEDHGKEEEGGAGAT